ncbi:hypothetical protein TcasGA2_TC008458 [Tribolium castaneum]|uniref:Uncharacterized protein n=1 Tax=Tribolium castaneum TaxID=7070 RepID=D2A240_TRICA|nr:hypothetical protein TcasGA2_TC008458 [Tribolium castaneum]
MSRGPALGVMRHRRQQVFAYIQGRSIHTRWPARFPPVTGYSADTHYLLIIGWRCAQGGLIDTMHNNTVTFHLFPTILCGPPQFQLETLYDMTFRQ